MDEELVEKLIRDLSRAYGYRFPSSCYRCGRIFTKNLIDALEKYVRGGVTLIEAVSRVRYILSEDRYVIPDEPGYLESLPLGVSPRELCCRISLISPFIYPTGTVVSHAPSRKIVGSSTSEFDLLDFLGETSAPRMEVDQDHGELRLFIEDGIPGFEPPITWTELDELMS